LIRAAARQDFPIGIVVHARQRRSEPVIVPLPGQDDSRTPDRRTCNQAETLFGNVVGESPVAGRNSACARSCGYFEPACPCSPPMQRDAEGITTLKRKDEHAKILGPYFRIGNAGGVAVHERIGVG
jgi:hypothetical protein